MREIRVGDLDRLLDEAEQALAEGNWRTALALAQEAEAIEAGCVDALFLQAEALLEGGEFSAAERRYRDVEPLAPDEPAVLSGRGMCLFELGRFDTAEQLLGLALELDPRMPEVHHTLGLLLERRGDEHSAKRHFQRARALAPEAYRPPVEIDAAAFDACIEAALLDLPPEVARAIENVSVSVEDLPSDEDLAAADPPLSPQLLGLWRGSPLSARTVFDPWSELPGGIVLYQKNLQRFARDRAELIEQIRVTVLHEVGHALGLSEEDLDERGLT